MACKNDLMPTKLSSIVELKLYLGTIFQKNFHYCFSYSHRCSSHYCSFTVESHFSCLLRSDWRWPTSVCLQGNKKTLNCEELRVLYVTGYQEATQCPAASNVSGRGNQRGQVSAPGEGSFSDSLELETTKRYIFIKVA